MATWRPDIYTYLSYRAYLGDYYAAAKANQPHFSYRYFSRRAGFSSSNFLKLIIDGKRNVSPESVDKIAEALSLTAEEHRFFAQLVELDQAPDQEARAQQMEAIMATRRFLEARPLDGLTYAYLSKWYHVAICELIAHHAFRNDPAWIASQLRPAISAAQAAQAIQTLLDLGLVVEQDGVLRREDAMLDAGHEVTAVGVREYHRGMLELARASIDTVPAPQRDISAMTVCIPAALVPEVKRRLQTFREQLMSFCEDHEQRDTVYQLTMQLFPLSQDTES